MNKETIEKIIRHNRPGIAAAQIHTYLEKLIRQYDNEIFAKNNQIENLQKWLDIKEDKEKEKSIKKDDSWGESRREMMGRLGARI